MKTYSHDYTLASKAESLLCEAYQLIAKEFPQDALQRIIEAREALGEYLAGDNMVLDDDVADGFIKQQETFNEDDIELIRDLLGEYLQAHPKASYADEVLQVINVCQVQSDCPEFENVQQFISNTSNSWAEIIEGESIDASGEESKPQTIGKNKCLDKIGVAQNILDCLNKGWQYQTADGTVHEYTDSERKAMFEKAYSDLNEVYNYVYYQS